MNPSSVILAVVALGAAVLLLQPRLSKLSDWRATVTPLASIIGSGFLVAAPILSEAAGRWAFVAMAALCGAGFLFGAAVRFNIAEVEPALKREPPRTLAVIERLSGLALALAYFISIAYYLNLFAAFALRGVGISDIFWTRCGTTIVLGALGVAGLTGGLRVFENVETLAVGLKLAVIAGLLSALVFADGWALSTGTLILPPIEHRTGWAEVQVLMGLVILVQGFETSRYLGEEYDGDVRRRTMLRAQWIATGIYVTFLVLTVPYFFAEAPDVISETAIIDMLIPLGIAVAPAIILTALASQLSAAVADLNGASGLLAENLGRWLNIKTGYVVAIAAALFITWTSDIFEIITYASKAFVLYYGLQSLAALWVTAGKGRWVAAGVFSCGLVLAALILVFAVPVSV